MTPYRFPGRTNERPWRPKDGEPVRILAQHPSTMLDAPYDHTGEIGWVLFQTATVYCVQFPSRRMHFYWLPELEAVEHVVAEVPKRVVELPPAPKKSFLAHLYEALVLQYFNGR